MSDYCLHSTIFPPQYSLRTHKLGFANYFKLPKSANCSIPNPNKSSISTNSTRNRDSIPFPSNEYENLEFEFMEKEKIRELEIEEPAAGSGIHEESDDLREFFKFRDEKKDNKLIKDEEFSKSQGLDSKFDELDRPDDRREVTSVKRMRQMMRRSNVIAKQVISISSAIGLGFVSQLWVNTTSWVVLVVEVKPNLLSGDSERFLLKEIVQLGDVILVEDENVIEDDFKMVGLETLVGYTVVTSSRQNIGKVRGYTFNINSGTVESLELDSFGISIIPSSLLSTYALFVEDVLEVLSDTVVVHEAALSRMQRLTKGFWVGQNRGSSNNEFGEQLDQADYRERRRRKSSTRKIRPKMRKSGNDWELPMDFL